MFHRNRSDVQKPEYVLVKFPRQNSREYCYVLAADQRCELGDTVVVGVRRRYKGDCHTMATVTGFGHNDFTGPIKTVIEVIPASTPPVLPHSSDIECAKYYSCRENDYQCECECHDYLSREYE